MPYKLSDDGMSVLKEDGTLVKKHDSKEKAKAHLAALEANVADAKSFLELMNVGEATKYGMTISSANMKKVQAMHDFCHELGAKCEGEMEEETEDKSFAILKDRLDLSYVKSLGISKIPDEYVAVKFVGKDTIKGYTFMWGDIERSDLEQEYFTQKTNFWDDVLGKSTRPLTWDHNQGKGEPTEMKDAVSPIIGNVTEFGDDEVGRWYTAVLDRSNKYIQAVTRLINQGRLGTSSDSAPQYVERVKTGKGVWLKTWPWFAAALTDAPCEPRMIGSLEFLKSLGVTLPDVNDIHLRYEHKKRQAEYLKLKSER